MKETTPLYSTPSHKLEKSSEKVLKNFSLLFFCGIILVLIIALVFFVVVFVLFFTKNKDLSQEISDLRRKQKPPTCLSSELFGEKLPELSNQTFHANMHREIRTRVILDFIELYGEDAIVYLEGKTDSIPVVGTRDNNIQNKNFLYIAGVFEAKYRVMINLRTKSTALFAYKLTDYDLKWSYLKQIPLSEQKEIYGVEEMYFNNVSALSNYTFRANVSRIYVEPGVELDFEVPEITVVNDSVIQKFLYDQRLVKHPAEIEVISYAIDVSSVVFKHMMQEVKFADFEFQMTGSFMENVLACGCFDTGYFSIMGSGRHAAILHYQTNAARIDHSKDMLLIDAGAGFFGYTADITRTFPTTRSGKYLPDHRVLYGMVLAVQNELVEMHVPEASYADIQVAAKKLIIGQLLENNFIHGDFDELVALKMDEIFFPHGLGHSLGLDVHDPGSFTHLEENMIITCEPGIYMIENLIQKASQQQKEKMNMEKINEFMSLGGVRIEDDILITSDGYRILGDAPKTIAEVEEYTTR